ncbi:hypothetical protein BSKO_10910 [Bryopsis sp. KO-2023]|nr:hypothetical protein BSKO_10910 [Bryopsis sp. KO-2023]
MECLGSLLVGGAVTFDVDAGQACEITHQKDVWSVVCEGTTIAEFQKVSQRRRKLWMGSLVECLGVMAAKSKSVEVSGVVACCSEGEAFVRFTVRAAREFLEGWAWGNNKLVARVFEALEPWDASSECMERLAWIPSAPPEPISINNLFKEVMTVEAAMADFHSRVQRSSWLEEIPHNALVQIFSALDPESFRRLQCCSRSLYLVGMEVIPCLTTELCLHQRDALMWMAMRERPPAQLPHPCYREVATSGGMTYSLNLLTGEVVAGPRPTVPDCRGGVLADEPGLGKTVTILSLVMRTKGMNPEPPMNSRPVFSADGQGNMFGYYSVPKAEFLASFKETESIASTPDRPSLKRRLRSDSLGPSSGESISPIAVYRKKARPSVTPKRSDFCDIELDCVKATDTWVQCDGCGKWRRLPENTEVDESSAWFCSLHPMGTLRCENYQERYDNQIVAEAPGYIPRGTPGGLESSVGHLMSILSGHAYALQRVGRHHQYAVDWLANQTPENLDSGVTIPMAYRLPPTYWKVFEALGMERVKPKKKRGSNTGAKESHTWRTPKTHSRLDFDVLGLKQALVDARAAESLVRVHLSKATLVVLPCTMINQWQEQVRQHFQGNLLRVKVLTNQSHYPEYIHDLAWNYDIVLTTFSHVSLEWRKHNSKLMQIHWLRIILDEGHIIGANPFSDTNRNRMLKALRAERRWVMTGTPTPNTPTAHVSHLHPLLCFLKQKPYGCLKREWEDMIERPYGAGLPAGKERLMEILRRIFIRSSKDKLRMLPPIKKTVKLLDFEPMHARSFNELVQVIKRNILLADWGEPGHTESLLNPKNSKWGREMAENLRLSCCVAGNTDLQVNELDLKETIELLASRMSIDTQLNDTPPYIPRFHPLFDIAEALRSGGICGKCLANVRLLVLTPCGHLLCTDCVGEDRFKCPIASCRHPYVMQSETDPHRFHHNPNPQRPVPIEIIEWQPSYAQRGAIGTEGGKWNADWEATKSSKCEYLVKRLKEIGAVCDEGSSVRTRPGTKAIVFSKFWRHLLLIERTFVENNIKFSFLRKTLPPGKKELEIDRFRKTSGGEECGVLLMDDSGAVGLDLSMASWVFLMEPLADKSLEEQIVSRAHRMGAKQKVNVEVLAMRGSAEEQLLKICSESQTGPVGKRKRPGEDNGQDLRTNLLSHLKRAKVNSS